MKAELPHWQRLRDAQVNDKPFTAQGPIIPGRKDSGDCCKQSRIGDWETPQKSKHIAARGGKPARVFQFAIFHLIFKSKKLKGSNKPLSFPIPPNYYCDVWQGQGHLAAWELKPRTGDRHSTRGYPGVLPAANCHAWTPPSMPSSVTGRRLSPSREWIEASRLAPHLIPALLPAWYILNIQTGIVTHSFIHSFMPYMCSESAPLTHCSIH